MRRLFSLVLVAVGLAAAGCAAEGDSEGVKQELSGLRADLEKTRQDQEKLQGQLATFDRRLAGLQEDLSASRRIAVEAAPAAAAMDGAPEDGAAEVPAGTAAAPAAATAAAPPATAEQAAILSAFASEQGRKIIADAIEADRVARDKERADRQVAAMVDRFAKQASLTEDQTKRMKDIMVGSAAVNREMWAPLRNGTEMSQEQRDALRQQNTAKADELRKQTDDSVKAVLSQTQWEMYQQEQDKLRSSTRGLAPAGGGQPNGNGRRNNGGRQNGQNQ